MEILREAPFLLMLLMLALLSALALGSLAGQRYPFVVLRHAPAPRCWEGWLWLRVGVLIFILLFSHAV